MGSYRHAMPKGARKDPIHPARRTFQALRIATNDELSRLEMVGSGVFSWNRVAC